PLAAGYLWLALLWLLFGSRVPEHPHKPSTTSGAIQRAWNDATPLGRALVLSFLAYLLGVVSVALFSRIATASPVESFNQTAWSSDTDSFVYVESSKRRSWLQRLRRPLLSRPLLADLTSWVERWHLENPMAVPQGAAFRLFVEYL